MIDLKRGTSPVIEVQFETRDKELVDPTTVTLCLVDSAGTEVVTEGSMTKLSTGIYTYTWQSEATSVLGYYRAYITAVSGTYNVKDNWSAFRLEA